MGNNVNEAKILEQKSAKCQPIRKEINIKNCHKLSSPCSYGFCLLFFQ